MQIKICTKYAAICSTKYARNMHKYAKYVHNKPQNMHKYEFYVQMLYA